MDIALGVTEIYADSKNKIKLKQGKVMKFDRKNTIELPLVSNKELSKGTEMDR